MEWLTWQKQEKIYLIDASDSPIKTVCAVSKNDKLFIHSYKEFHLDDSSSAILSTNAITNFLDILKIPKNSIVIFLWNSNDAVTYNSIVQLEKQHSDVPLAKIDLTRILGTATLQSFNQFREEAKKRFMVDDLGLVLVSNRILELKLDGEMHINLANITAKRADVAIEQTFIRREIHEKINYVLDLSCKVLHIEIGAALHMLAKIGNYNVERALLLHTGFEKTHLYTTHTDLQSPGTFNPLLQYRGVINLGVRNFFEALFDNLGVREEDADTFFMRIINEGASIRLTSAVKKAMQGTCSKFIEECHTNIPQSERLFFFTQEPLASFLESVHFSKNIECIVPFSLHRKDIAQPEIRPSPRLSPRALSPVFFAGLIAYWSRLSDNYLGSRNLGNVKWLIPHNSI